MWQVQARPDGVSSEEQDAQWSLKASPHNRAGMRQQICQAKGSVRTDAQVNASAFSQNLQVS